MMEVNLLDDKTNENNSFRKKDFTRVLKYNYFENFGKFLEKETPATILQKT